MENQQNIQSAMRNLIDRLTQASKAYYSEDQELMTNYEYDALYQQLEELEKSSGLVYPDSPTQKVGYEVVSSLPKIRHASPMKSLDKTKDIKTLQTFLAGHKGILSWKLDGLTCVVTYENGRLVQAATRGNGEVGEVITPNARTFSFVPLNIAYHGHLVIRGEALISYEDFARINASLPPEEQYKNPRNLCAGSVRQLDSSVTASRHVALLVYTLVESDQPDSFFHDSKAEQIEWMRSLGFTPVEYRKVTSEDLTQAEQQFTASVGSMKYPVDGLVLTFDSISESRNAGSTAKFPRDSMAFKWQDETEETTLLEVEWSPSRTGLINPVAVFEPVELEGTTVQRASLHNVSILKQLKIGIGDRITIYKANMIIPQIAENLTKSGNLPIPQYCPRCGGETKIVTREDVQVLVCTNPSCPAKLIKSLEHFVSRPAMNIEGLSEATLEKLADENLVASFADLYRLKEHREQLIKIPGFGEKSADNLLLSIEHSRHTDLSHLLCAIGIPGIGSSTARLLSHACGQDLTVLRSMSDEDLSRTEGIGPVLAQSICRYFSSKDNLSMLDDLLAYLDIEKTEEPLSQGEKGASPVAGKTFVITGSLNHFANRDELKEKLISLGAKVSGSVSRSTSYLINNDISSTSGKNKKASELGIPVISEDALLDMISRPVS